MGRHTTAHGGYSRATPPGEVTVARIAQAFASLGFDAHERPDRVVLGLPAVILTAWIDYERPLAVVLDMRQRVPVAFEHSAALAAFINSWNRGQLGPSATYRLTDAGDFDVRLRTRRLIRHGLTDEQLFALLIDALEHTSSFSTQLRARFLDIGFDTPLPPTLMRAMDFAALDGELTPPAEVYGAPDAFLLDDAAATPHEAALADFAEALEALEFVYADMDDAFTTAVNGVPFALTLDGGSYARVTAMWNSRIDAESGFLSTSLICNDAAQQGAASVYVDEVDGELHVHAEMTQLVTGGWTQNQRDDLVVSALLACLAAVDQVSARTVGASAVQWPPAQ